MSPVVKGGRNREMETRGLLSRRTGRSTSSKWTCYIAVMSCMCMCIVCVCVCLCACVSMDSRMRSGALRGG
jgi:hypothetical protein